MCIRDRYNRYGDKMKIKLYFGQEDAIKKSGIGRAFVHQKKALELSGIPYTTDKDDLDYDILHINTVWPDSFKIINQARKYNKKIVYHAQMCIRDRGVNQLLKKI